MSDDYAAEPSAAPAEAAPDSGQGTEAPAPEPTYLDTSEYSDHHVRIKVDGEEQSVPLSEALAGYSRQADYTRKTQELSRQAQEHQFALTLQRALENNPEATIRLLQDQYGLTAAQAKAAAASDDDDSWLDEDPDAQRWKQYDQRLQEQEDYRAAQELDQALRFLRHKYGEDFDPNTVVARAAQLQRMDLEGVYREMAFDKYWKQSQGQRAAEQQRSGEEQQRVAAKSNLGVQVGSGTNGAVAEPEAGQAVSIEAAWAEAKRMHGLTS